MKVRNIIHRGLRRFVEDDDVSGLQRECVAKLRRMITFLQDMEREDEVLTIMSWKAHRLKGARKGTWSLTVTRNWRLTYRVDQEEIEIVDLNYEDYH